MKVSAQPTLLLLAFLLSSLVLSACNSDLNDNEEPESGIPTITTNTDPATGVGTDDFVIQLASGSISIVEGQDSATIGITLARASGHQNDITLTLTASSEGDAASLTSQFSDITLSGNETTSSLQLGLAIASRPIQSHSRTLNVRATDSAGQVSVSQLILNVQPTTSPDIYLLIGQSNMVGISEDEARQSEPGEPDEPLPAIRQLNVTFNDEDNFATAADFVTPANLFNSGNPLTIALDPLHNGLEGDGDKSGMRIGMGLSFAKRALSDTTAEIYLVPAAWSDTGFCVRDTNILPGLGWNATEKTNPALSGTLLHDRAIERIDNTIALTGGVLRGILWHQGEGDSDDTDCAETYAENLAEMVESMRTNIAEDARGPAARGPEADIPFVVGTMAMGEDQAPFSDTKLIVDAVHRNVASLIPFASFVNNDDLVPPGFACGGGSCIHFGADALREMGARYYEQMISVLP